MNNNSCICTGPGWCQQHQRTMNPVRYDECKNKGYYWVFQKDLSERISPGPEKLPPVHSVSPQESEPTLPMWNCTNRGKKIRDGVCNQCGMKGQPFSIYECTVHRECSIRKYRSGVRDCFTCEEFDDRYSMTKNGIPTWSYGITTVPSRRMDLFPRTLKSLSDAGFNSPRVFADGCYDMNDYSGLCSNVTMRYPVIKTFGNWILALAELYIREPHADRYAMFQDDILMYRNLRAYLDKVQIPSDGYLNLYTFPENQKIAPEGVGFYRSNQRGLGAVALVFSRQGITKLLGSPDVVSKPRSASRGWRNVDGLIVHAMKAQGFYEYVHNPSLVQHTGDTSSMGSKRHPKAESFRGEDFDAMELLACGESETQSQNV